MERTTDTVEREHEERRLWEQRFWYSAGRHDYQIEELLRSLAKLGLRLDRERSRIGVATA